MRTWKEVLKEAEQKELEALNAGLPQNMVEEVIRLREEAEELKPTVFYTVYGFDMGKYREEGKIQCKLITDSSKAEEIMNDLQVKAMTCKVDGETHHIQFYNVDGKWYPLILGSGRTLQSIGTAWAKNMKKTIEMFSFGRHEKHEAIYNEYFETVSFS